MKTLKNNWKIKLISLILAILLWSFVIASENPTLTTRFTNVPVILENEEYLFNSGLELMNYNKTTVDLQVSGKRNQLINLTASHFRVTADLYDLKEGVNLVELKYSLPVGTSLVNEPRSISLDIQKIINKDFAINIETIGELKENYILESKKATPEKISINGARSSVEKVESVKAILNLSEVEDDIITNVNIVAVDKEGKQVENIKLGQNFVNINAIISKTKEVEIRPKFSDNLDSDYKLKEIKLNPNKIYIKGNKKYIDSIEFINTKLIDLSKVIGSFKETVKLDLPENIAVVNSDIQIIGSVEIESKKTKMIEIPIPEIQVIKQDSQTFTNQNLKYYIEVKGFAEEVDKLTSKDFIVKLDLKELTSGNHWIEPEIKTTKKIDIVNINKISITID